MSIQAAAAAGCCGVETAAALALGEIRYIAREKSIQKWCKEKLGARAAANKKRTAAAMEAGRSAASPVEPLAAAEAGYNAQH